MVEEIREMNKLDQSCMPLIDHLKNFSSKKPVSFHVPGHKHGYIFPEAAKELFDSVLPVDVTEIAGMDDLHAPSKIIAEAEELAKDYFKSDHTFFLVGGSTVGNLAMIMTACNPGDEIIVQRNCHKSIINGLELAGAKPIFIAPEWRVDLQRYAAPSYDTVKQAILRFPNAKALILTYPDYFGMVFDIQSMIEFAHSNRIPVFVDEAHGVHFSTSEKLPQSALQLGADVVVQSAHKMAPAMTMAAYLHIGTSRVEKNQVAYYLQMLQSSSPSYPIMASLDAARFYLAELSKEKIQGVLNSVEEVRNIFSQASFWEWIPSDDPLKLTFHVKHGYKINEIETMFENHGIYPELTTENQFLFIHGLAPFVQQDYLKKTIQLVEEQLKKSMKHATIEGTKLFTNPIEELALSYQEMKHITSLLVPFAQSEGEIAAEAVIPYPPGIPVILKGERITEAHITKIQLLIQQGVTIQQREEGIRIYRKA